MSDESKKPLNIQQALGIPSPEGPTKTTEQESAKVLALAVKYLLYERREETALTAGFAQLVEERHNNFHVKAFDSNPVKWTECSNKVCKEAVDIIKSAKAMEVNINPLAAELMSRYRVNFMPMPANLRFWLVKLDNAVATTADEQKQASRVVLEN